MGTSPSRRRKAVGAVAGTVAAAGIGSAALVGSSTVAVVEVGSVAVAGSAVAVGGMW